MEIGGELWSRWRNVAYIWLYFTVVAHCVYPGKGIFLWFEGFSLKLFQI